jgi:hypothetical protein
MLLLGLRSCWVLYFKAFICMLLRGLSSCWVLCFKQRLLNFKIFYLKLFFYIFELF